MRRFGNWSVTMGTLAFMVAPLLVAGCAEDQSASAPAAGGAAAAPADDDLGDLSEDLGEPMEAGSGLGLPEAGSALE